VWQEWECFYSVHRARRLRNAASFMHAKPAAACTTIISQVPAYLASRVGAAGTAVPEVEVRGRNKKGGNVRLREEVLRHVVEGMRGELFREWVDIVEV
jgi:hypothetical protein